MTVPTGVWQRDWIRRHGGPEDARVGVRYVQTPSAFGDLRIPGDRPEMAAAGSLAALGDAQLAALARQNGFAGVATMDGATATWHHEIDFQPASGGVDSGRIEPAGEGRMFEHGLDGSYVESWSAIDRGGGFLAARVERTGKLDQLLVVAGRHFMYARARAAALPAGDSLTELIERTHATREAIIAWLDCEISFGAVRGWQIERSTLPWRQGQALGFAARIAVDASGRPLARDAGPGETWSFPVVELPASELRTLFVERP